MFDIDFLLDYNAKLNYHLKQLFDNNKKCIYFLIKNLRTIYEIGALMKFGIFPCQAVSDTSKK